MKEQSSPALGPQQGEIYLHARVEHEQEKPQVGQEGQPLAAELQPDHAPAQNNAQRYFGDRARKAQIPADHRKDGGGRGNQQQDQ